MNYPTDFINKAILGDCLEIMKDIPAKSIDMILCDLPYGVTACKWDIVIPFEPLWEQYKRIIRDRGAIVLTASQPFTSALIMSNPKWFKYCWVWVKENGTGFLNAKKQPLKIAEDIIIFSNNSPRYYPQMRQGFKPYTCKSGTGSNNYGRQEKVITTNNGSRYPINLLEIERDNNKIHPTQKPVALFEYLIKTYTKEGEIVLDNCAGSGTTGIAAINTGRQYILIEKDEAYYKSIQDRIDNHIIP